jgi:predicted amidohydrolase YtcJ
MHCELCHPDQVERIARLGAFCDMQAGQLTSEASFLPSVIGRERMMHCFPFRSLIDAGVIVVGSSDAPTEPPNPMIAIRAAVVRHPTMNLDERISLHEALQMYTINAQKLIMNNHKKGLLVPGHLADIAVFEDNLFAVHPEALDECKVAATIVNGQIAYKRAAVDVRDGVEEELREDLDASAQNPIKVSGQNGHRPQASSVPHAIQHL